MDIATPDDQGPAPSRRRVITGVLQAFLDNAPDQGFLILGDPERPDEFVQFKRSAGIIYGEVGSRQWDAPERRRPLSPDAEATLAREGFTHGGVEKNYCRDELAQSAPYLAELVDRLVAAAYGRDFVDAPQVSSDVEPVCAAARSLGARVRPPSPGQPFDRELHYRRLWEPLRTTPGLAARAGRALRSNFFDQQLDTEDVLGFRAAVEAASGFDELPTWAQDWIRKAEQGPLQVRLRPPAWSGPSDRGWIHARQVRKSTSIPYVGHLLGVASLVIEEGGSDDEVIAALLHDAVEDQAVPRPSP